MRVHILHENDEWTAPLLEALRTSGVPASDWHLASGQLDLSTLPPDGVFYSRMSASAHLRGHRYAPEYTQAILSWLESHGRRIINGRRALELELSKATQLSALAAYGIPTPRSILVHGREALFAAADRFAGRRFILKPNRGGRGDGVRLFEDLFSLKRHVTSCDFKPPVDGSLLLQEYIQPATPHITRLEFVGGALLYAVRVNTSEGFQLCPGDTQPHGPLARNAYEIIPDFSHPLVASYQRFMELNGLDICAFEFIESKSGLALTYDINVNTTYNHIAELRAGIFGMQRVASFLHMELRGVRRRAAA